MGNPYTTTHGLKYTRLYRIHNNMKQRCYNPNNTCWMNYGGRGIKICDEWISIDYENRINSGFLNFYHWAMNNGYTDDLTIDRIDPNGNYCPENCRWVDRKFQCNNRGDNHYIYYNGYNFTITIWSEITKISADIITSRLKKGWTTEQILRTPLGSSRWSGEYLAWNVPIEYVKYHNPDLNRKQMNAVRGPLPEETKRKLSEANRGRPKYNDRKLSEEQVFQLYDLAQEGHSQRKIGSIFGMDHSTVHDIIHGKTYVNCYEKYHNAPKYILDSTENAA